MNRMRTFPDDARSDSGHASLAKLNSLQEQLDDLRNRLIAPSSNNTLDTGTLGQLAREILDSRRRRAVVFRSSDLFGEPAWDILLGLYVAAEEQQKLSATSVCEVSGAPMTTTLRWIERLENEGWVHRTPDPLDRRRFWVLLTERASNTIRSYLEGIGLRPNHLA